MGYLLTKQADAVSSPTPLGIPYTKINDREVAGNVLGGLIAGGGLAATGTIGNSLFEKKYLNDKAYSRAIIRSEMKMMDKMNKSKSPIIAWLRDCMTKPVPGSSDIKLSALGKGMHLAHGFRWLRGPGKLKALGLVAAPLVAGGTVATAIE